MTPFGPNSIAAVRCELLPRTSHVTSSDDNATLDDSVALVALISAAIPETSHVYRQRRFYREQASRHASHAAGWQLRAKIAREQIRSAEETVAQLRRLKDRGEFRCEDSLWIEWQRVIDS